MNRKTRGRIESLELYYFFNWIIWLSLFWRIENCTYLLECFLYIVAKTMHTIANRIAAVRTRAARTGETGTFITFEIPAIFTVLNCKSSIIVGSERPLPLIANKINRYETLGSMLSRINCTGGFC